jgi:FkbM family methyltransferase
MGLGCAAITLRVGYLMESVSKTVCRDAPPSAEAWLGVNGGAGGATSLLRAASSSASPPSPVDRYITKRTGVQWSVWDRKSVLHSDAGTCQWREFKPAGQSPENNNNKGRAPTFMCLYPRKEDVYVSANIEDRGHWPNCDDITNQLRGIKDAVYMDIGANIGACVMQVLHTTDATVVAFEPSPKNLFRLTSTLLSLPEEMKNRVTLYPVALGDRPATAAIMASPKNAGNTQVKRANEDQGRDGANVETHDIPVERLDDLLSSDLNVDLLK